MSSHSPPILLFNNTTNSTTTTTTTTINESIKTSILIIVLILSLTIILCLTLCLILRHLNLRLLSSFSAAAAPSTATATTASASSNRNSSHRVSPESFQLSVVDSLPLFTFGSIKRRSSSAAAADCAVCLCNFEPEDQLRLLPLCCHAFHSHCIDTWLHSNLTCPLCRSPIHASDSDLMKVFSSAPAPAADATRDGSGGSFRLEIGSVSLRRQADHEPRRSYSIGSFEYVVEEESEVTVSETHRRTVSDKEIFGSVTEDDSLAAAAAHEPSLAEEVASGGRSWLKDYIDRLSSSISSRTMSFRGSGRFFTGSSRRSESVVGEYDVEANHVGEEISEFFRWFSGI